MARGNREEDVPKGKVNKETLRDSLFIFKYLKPYKTKFITALALIVLSSATTMSFPYLLKALVDSANNVKPKLAILARFADPTHIALLMIGILAVQMVISFLRVYLITTVGENGLADMRKDIYKHLIIMPMDFFAQRRVGELSSRLSADVSQIQNAITSMLVEIIRGVLTLLIGIGLILFISPKLTLIMLSVIPVLIIVAVVFGKRIRGLSKKAQDELADSGTIVQESLQGISNVKAFSNEMYEVKRYNNSINNVVKLAIKNGQYNGFFVSFLLFSVFGAIVLVVWYGAGLMQLGQLSFGDLTAFVIYTAFVGGTMAGFADLYGQLQKTLGATQRVREILNEVPENVLIKDNQLQVPFKLSGQVSLQHVGFSYASRRETPVLKDISIDASRGEQIAIVGPSGAGKSTLVSLLLRFYEPDSGKILFDGMNARDIPLSQLRKQMALVPQDVLLFGGTIFENIAYGKTDATQEEIEQAARQANAHHFINSFPEGYQTVVGERGVKLSGGQRQRIAIARAILKDPAILILDEATSSLDSESEQLVQEALQNLMRGRTSFVIAHRLSTIRNADKIVVLDNGYVKERGSHQELVMIEDGLYRNLSRIQNSIMI